MDDVIHLTTDVPSGVDPLPFRKVGSSDVKVVISDENYLVDDIHLQAPIPAVEVLAGNTYVDAAGSLVDVILVEDTGNYSEAVNIVRPSIDGPGIAGEEHSGNNGLWENSVDFEERWLLNGAVVEDGSLYTPPVGTIVYQVRAQDENGIWSPWASSDPMIVTQTPEDRGFSDGFSDGFG